MFHDTCFMFPEPRAKKKPKESSPASAIVIGIVCAVVGVVLIAAMVSIIHIVRRNKKTPPSPASGNDGADNMTYSVAPYAASTVPSEPQGAVENPIYGITGEAIEPQGATAPVLQPVNLSQHECVKYNHGQPDDPIYNDLH